MTFEPDIVVTAPDATGLQLVVETKPGRLGHERSALESQLKRYLVDMQCPVGLLVTPERIWIYRNLYTSYSDDSVERIGEYSTEGIFGERTRNGGVPLTGLAFQDSVQRWLQELNEESRWRVLPDPLREAIEENVLPALARGQVRAAGPR